MRKLVVALYWSAVVGFLTTVIVNLCHKKIIVGLTAFYVSFFLAMAGSLISVFSRVIIADDGVDSDRRYKRKVLLSATGSMGLICLITGFVLSFISQPFGHLVIWAGLIVSVLYFTIMAAYRVR